MAEVVYIGATDWLDWCCWLECQCSS